MIILIALILCIFVGLIYGRFHWQIRTRDLRTRLKATGSNHNPTNYNARETNDLPIPVQRYFKAVLTDTQPIILTTHAWHKGQFNMSETIPQWRPFTSTQMVITQRPGFDWDGCIRIAPGIKVYVHDAYVSGRGMMHAMLLGLVTLADAPDSPELLQGELIRFLAEAPWYPTALLPSQGVRWEAIDEISARATLTDGATTVSVVFNFDTEGLISAVNAAARYRIVKGASVPTPWQGRFWAYTVKNAMRIPLEGEVAWQLPEGPWAYWRGRITKIVYEFAD